MLVAALGSAACAGSGQGGPGQPGGMGRQGVRPGISVLLDDSIRLIAGKRVGLITNQTGVDERGRSSIDLLSSDPRATAAEVRLVSLFSPEHGIRGTEDRQHIASERDAKTGLPVHSLYTAGTIAPPDSTLRDVEVLVVDLQDIGTRTWTYVGVMLYAMHAAGRVGIPIVVLDRPNPISGARTEGALLDTALANPDEPTATRRGNGFALWPVPLRHGLTMGELARYLHQQLQLSAKLTVVPMQGWRRTMWFDDTRLPWVRPSPNMPTLTSALLYPAVVPFESSALSVGRGTNEPFQRVGAPWLRADLLAKMLEELALPGVRFRAERFTPVRPTDGKYAGRNIPGVRIEVLNREVAQPARIGAALLWGLARLHADSLGLRERGFDERLGSTALRQALVRGDDPDGAIDRLLPAVVDFERDAKRIHLYR